MHTANEFGFSHDSFVIGQDHDELDLAFVKDQPEHIQQRFLAYRQEGRRKGNRQITSRKEALNVVLTNFSSKSNPVPERLAVVPGQSPLSVPEDSSALADDVQAVWSALAHLLSGLVSRCIRSHLPALSQARQFCRAVVAGLAEFRRVLLLG